MTNATKKSKKPDASVWVSASDKVAKRGAEKREDGYWFLPENIKVAIKPGSDIFDERVHLPFDEGRVLQIMEFGWFGSVTVRKNGADTVTNVDIIELLDGRKRRAALLEANRRRKKLGLDPILMKVEFKDAQGSNATGIMLAANTPDPDTAIDIAEKVEKMILQGDSWERCSIAARKPISTIKRYKKLLALHADCRRALRLNLISLSTAFKLANLHTDQQVALLESMVATFAKQKEAEEALADEAPKALEAGTSLFLADPESETTGALGGPRPKVQAPVSGVGLVGGAGPGAVAAATPAKPKAKTVNEMTDTELKKLAPTVQTRRSAKSLKVIEKLNDTLSDAHKKPKNDDAKLRIAAITHALLWVAGQNTLKDMLRGTGVRYGDLPDALQKVYDEEQNLGEAQEADAAEEE